MVNNELPPNSHKHKEEEAFKPKIQRVINTEVKTRRRSLSRRFSDIFFDQDAGDIKSYLFIEVFVPAIKNLILDIVNQGLGMKFYGSGRAYSNRSNGGNNQKTPYGSFFRPQSSQNNSPSKSRVEYSRVSHDFDDIILESKGEADQVIDILNEAISQYGQATVADLYDAVGKTTSFTDNSFGWFDLKRARSVRVRDGYLLDLPRPVSLK